MNLIDVKNLTKRFPMGKGEFTALKNINLTIGKGEFVVDGVMYRVIECDGLEMFADRGLYLGISTGGFGDFFKAFNYNEETGEISPKADYKGANALFNLPLDVTKADHEKAEKYLKELLDEPEADSRDNEEKNEKDIELADKSSLIFDS